ncbi:GDP-D-glucose phosphorylase 1 [Musca vetustissima]|uniref:GDP-D-glucose phosphorylase 1 n=1 Tax=Musca vetustissima TaxID=27455 RepID=UPI002AB6E0EA|nr:GDP-D-glucose phosphorylase 1 [Musca vetustissima]
MTTRKIAPKSLLNELKEKWQQLQTVPNIFAYRLNVTESKILPGEYGFYSEFNPERTALRRAPQTIISLDPVFNEEKFNFKKIKPEECLMKVEYEGSKISMIINNSPLTLYHTLICPDVHMGLPQRICERALRFCVAFLEDLMENDERNFRIGYNSPGALASVNHLHLHLMYIEKDLYIDRVNLELLSQPDVFRLAPNMPTEAICFQIKPSDSDSAKLKTVQKLNKFLQWLCTNNMPHNLFLTPERNPQHKEKPLKIFVFVRQEYCIVKNLNTYNIGFCELAGYVPVGAKQFYEQLNEKEIIQKINQETGSVFSKIYNYFINVN